MDRWAAAGVPTWPGTVLVVLWAMALSIATLGEAPCTPAAPCAPEPLFAVLIALGFATPALLLVLPALGSAAGIAFGVVVVLLEDVTVARVAFGLHGLLCAAYVLLLWAAARRQRLLLRTARLVVPCLGRAGLRWTWRLGAAAALSAVTPGLIIAYLAIVGNEQEHLQRAVVTTAVVLDPPLLKERTIALQLEDEEVEVGVESSGNYVVGSTTPVLLDPQDEDWLALAAEPRDDTSWVTAASAAMLLGAVLVGQELRRRRAISALLGTVQPGVAVHVRTRGSAVRVFMAGRQVARFSTAQDQGKPVTGTAARERNGFVVAGGLFGDLRHRGWAAVLLEDGTLLLPASPLEVPT